MCGGGEFGGALCKLLASAAVGQFGISDGAAGDIKAEPPGCCIQMCGAKKREKTDTKSGQNTFHYNRPPGPLHNTLPENMGAFSENLTYG